MRDQIWNDPELSALTKMDEEQRLERERFLAQMQNMKNQFTKHSRNSRKHKKKRGERFK